MPYLPVDLDGKRRAGLIDKALGLPTGTVMWGLLELWETVWRTKRDVVTALDLDCSFGPDGRIPAAMVSSGFLEPVGGDYRVKGAAKWLFGMEGKSRGGKAAKNNLIPGARQKKAAEAEEAEGSAEKPEPILSAPAESQPRPPLGSLSALTSSIQHPASSIVEDLFGAAPQSPASKPTRKPKADKPTDPRHAPMVRRLGEVFEQARGAKYVFDGGNDGKALTALLAMEPTDDEIARRFAVGLGWRGFPACNGVRDLHTHWNAYARAGPVRDFTKGRVGAEEIDWSGQTSGVSNDF